MVNQNIKASEIIVETKRQGDFGEGFANYFKDSVSGLWFSCNGWAKPEEIRWQVQRPLVIAKLESN